ncbi:MAG: response regulator transcription factor [Syntrophobacteraceae bacterium]
MCFVLIVEDNSTFRQSLREMLALRFPSLGIEEASNGDEALMAVQTANPDLIFMDIKLPGKNGLELTRMIKKSNSRAEVVILTSYDIPEYREAAFQSGASHFFTKGSAMSEDIADVVKSTFALKGKSLGPCLGTAVS